MPILFLSGAGGFPVPRVAVLRDPCRVALLRARVSEYRDPWHDALAQLRIQLGVTLLKHLARDCGA